MNAIDQYNFDRMGYLHIPGFLSKDVAANLHSECQALEAHALAADFRLDV